MSATIKVSVAVLPEWDPARGRRWSRVEEFGFAHAWSLDHLAWRSQADEPWHATVSALAAAALRNSRIGLGTYAARPYPRRRGGPPGHRSARRRPPCVVARGHRGSTPIREDRCRRRRCLGWLPSFSGSGIRGGSRNPNAVGHMPTLNITLFTPPPPPPSRRLWCSGCSAIPSRLRPYRSKALFPQ